jgi:biotin carboxyl carrier protein
MEYIQGKFVQLADSLIAPIWAWVMARSWTFRLAVLVLGGVTALAWNKADIVSENYRLGISVLKVATADDGLALDSDTKAKLISTTQRLDRTVKADLTSFAGLVPWSIAQAIVALEGQQPTTVRPGYAQKAISLIRSNETDDCFCWAEIPSKKTDQICTFIAGWVMLAFSNLGETISDGEVTHILEAQKADGWWPMFEDMADEAFASTYSTAWIVLGLAEMNRRELISSAMRSRAEDAVARGVAWLLHTRTDLGKWKPYPNIAKSRESDSISGLVLHTLHVADPSGLRELDRDWLSSLPRTPPEAPLEEGSYVEFRGRFDHFQQITLPWMLIATVDAYPSGDIFQRARARNWIDSALSERSVLAADADTNNWWRAELLYALKYVRRLAAE